MNWPDYVIIVVLALSVLVGLWRGFVTEVLALAVWVAAFWLAWLFGPRVAALFRPSIHELSVRIILGYALCFVAVLILGALVKFIMDKLVKGTGLSGTDRMLGMVFGLARGALLVTLVVFLMGFTPFSRTPWWHDSQLLPTFVVASHWMGNHLPQSVRSRLHTHDAPQPHIDLPQQAAMLQRDAALASKVSAVSGRVKHALAPDPPGAASSATHTAPRVAPPAHSRDN